MIDCIALSMLCPPALCLLTIGSFTAVYTAWFNYPRSKEEIPLCISDIILDIFATGIGAFGVQWFFTNGMKIFSWIISIFPILLVITVAIIVIITRIQTEKKMSIMRTVEKSVSVTSEDEQKIRTRIAKC